MEDMFSLALMPFVEVLRCNAARYQRPGFCMAEAVVTPTDEEEVRWPW